MMMFSNVALLIEKYLDGTATTVEREAVDAWYDSFDKAPGLTEIFSQKEIGAFLKSAFSNLHDKVD